MNAMIATLAPRPFAAGVLQLVRSDLRRARLLASMVVALELIRAAFAEWTLHVVPVTIGERFGGAFGIGEIETVDAVLWLATVLTAAAIVQADLPSDDRAFWRTRPIPPLTLAVAKLATCLLLFVAVPWIVNTGRLLAYGAPVSSLLAAGVQFFVLAGYALVPAWVLALVTRTLPRMIAVGLGVTVGVFLASSALLYWSSLWSGGVGSVSGSGPPAFLLDWQRLDARGWWGGVVITAAALGIVVAHYAHRRRAISIAAAVVLLTGSWAVPSTDWPRAVPDPLVRRVSGQVDVANGIALPPPSLLESYLRSSTAYPVPLSAELILPPLPSDISASVFLRQIRLHGRRTIAPRDAWQCCFNGGVIGVVAPALAQPATAEGLYPATRQGFEVDIADVDDLRGRDVALEADAEVRLLQHRFAATIPLRPGAALRVGDRLIEVLAFEPRLSAVLVRYAEFPVVSGRRDSALTLFVGDRTRNRVSGTTLGWGGRSVNDMMSGPKRTSSGREWVARHYVLVSDGKVAGPDMQVYIVETTEIGVVRTPLTKTGLRVWTPDESASPR
jgi:hypothetical protein